MTIAQGVLVESGSISDEYAAVIAEFNTIDASDIKRNELYIGVPSVIYQEQWKEGLVGITGYVFTPHAYNYVAGTTYPGFSTSTTGWMVVNDAGSAGGGDSCSITLASVDLSSADYAGILVIAELQNIRWPNREPALTHTAMVAFVALQANIGGVWTTLTSTIRFYGRTFLQTALTGSGYQDRSISEDHHAVSIMHLQRTGVITGFRLAVSIGGNDTSLDQTMQLGHASIYAIVLYGEKG